LIKGKFPKLSELDNGAPVIVIKTIFDKSKIAVPVVWGKQPR